MFLYETQMVAPAAKWLEQLGLTVKNEFVTPWGICDLVGASLDPQQVSKRLEHRQTKPVASVTRAAILLQIPDVESENSITLGKLVRDYAPVIPQEIVIREIERLIEDRYVVRSGRNRLQKLNGWMPLHRQLVAVELKLSRVNEAMTQAVSNLGFAGESYVGLPSKIAKRVAANKQRWAKHFDKGIGLLAVSARSCSVLVPVFVKKEPPNPALQFYCVEKFWRTYPKGS